MDIEERLARLEKAVFGNDIEKSHEDKIQYSDYVFLTAREYEKLIKDYGEGTVKRMIDTLDSYIGSRGLFKKYKDHNKTIRQRLIKAGVKKIQKIDEPKIELKGEPISQKQLEELRLKKLNMFSNLNKPQWNN